jgi:phage gp36-like protein
MYITIEELKTALYAYQAQEIVEADNDILLMNIAAAEAEVRSYLAGAYDVEAIFAAKDADRNPLLMELTKNIAVWYIVRLSNVDLIYQHAKERYDAAIDWLTKVAEGTLTPDLPAAPIDDDPTGSGVSWGSSEARNNNDY